MKTFTVYQLAKIIPFDVQVKAGYPRQDFYASDATTDKAEAERRLEIVREEDADEGQFWKIVEVSVN